MSEILKNNLELEKKLKTEKKLEKSEDKEVIKNNIENKNLNKEVVNLETSVHVKKLKEEIEISTKTKKDLTQVKKEHLKGKIAEEIKKVNKNIDNNQENINENNLDSSGINFWGKLLTKLMEYFTSLFGNKLNISGVDSSNNYNQDDIGDYSQETSVEHKEINYKTVEEIYNKYPNYKKYREFISLESKKLGISELEVLKLLTKENATANYELYGPGENTTIYGIGQMSLSTWRLVEKEIFHGKKMNRYNPYDQISMAIGYMKYIKKIRHCTDAETKFFYNAGHGFKLNNKLVNKQYISGNLRSIVYKNPKYRGKSINYIANHMTNKEYYEACMAYYDGKPSIYYNSEYNSDKIA